MLICFPSVLNQVLFLLMPGPRKPFFCHGHLQLSSVMVIGQWSYSFNALIKNRPAGYGLEEAKKFSREIESNV